MSQTFGIQAARTPPSPQGPVEALQPAGKYLVLIDSAGTGGRLARVFLSTLDRVAEYDATAPEVLAMIDGLTPSNEAALPRWDKALMGHSTEERAGAEVYLLES